MAEADGAVEPLVHSHLTDTLPDAHPLVGHNVYCKCCNAMLHCENNECMQTWLELPSGAYCTRCYPITPVLPFSPGQSA